ncbi:hypothetical protein PVAND_012271 [Polypedilum vanderplanki]|uniref:Uncharacterized protein n=1 Tax=Polypedilum vanderplanki TaxID=319348 RepID=A0A9J6CL29_POLVA|nr:hypothetical protein PVAND_012271 [Polypedilum vanderplanki]
MNQLNICIFALLIVVFSDFSQGKLPSYIKICNRNDPNIAKCITESVKNLQPRLATGINDGDFKVPPLEPIKVDNIHIDRGPNFQAQVKNVITRGAGKFVIEKMKVNLNDLIFDFQILLPKLEYKGKYSINIKIINVVPIIVNDKEFIGWAHNFRARVRLTGKKYTGPDGRTYIHFLPIQIKILADTGNFDILLTDLFENSPTLEAIGKIFIAENKHYFLNEVIPSLEKNLSKHFTEASNEIVKRSSFDELFPN